MQNKLKTKTQNVSVNFEYEITNIDNNTVTLTSIASDETIVLSKFQIDKHFIFSYCRTCHSFQGSSIDGEICIFDHDFFFVSRKWIYTAVTRATELKNVFFYGGKTDTYDETKLNTDLDTKLDNYKKQDKTAGRTISKNHITKELLKSQCWKTLL